MRKLPKIKVNKLEIGCGPNKQRGFIGIDIKDSGQEIVWDVRQGIPLPDNSVEQIWSSHVLEHFTDAESKELFKEIYRVLKPGGKIRSATPHAMDPTAYYFDHLTFWNEARIQSLLGVPGLEGFKIINNVASDNRGMLELYFELEKL